LKYTSSVSSYEREVRSGKEDIIPLEMIIENNNQDPLIRITLDDFSPFQVNLNFLSQTISIARSSENKNALQPLSFINYSKS
jgi:hypothetical protein